MVKNITFLFLILTGISSTSIAMNENFEYEELWESIDPIEPTFWQSVEDINPTYDFSDEWDMTVGCLMSMNDLVDFESALHPFRKKIMLRRDAFKLMKFENQELQRRKNLLPVNGINDSEPRRKNHLREQDSEEEPTCL